MTLGTPPSTPAASEAVARAAAPPTLPLLGRATELATLAAALTAAGEGRGGTALLVGDTGVGKTRLAQAVVDLATRRGFTVASGRAYAVETGVPYALFADALVPVLRAMEPSVLSLLSRGATAELAQLFPALAATDRAPAPRGDPAEVRARLLWNFTQFLSRFAARRPLLLVLDNLHWADPSSLELLHFTARQIAGDRILVVATSNDAELAPGAAPRELAASLEAIGVARTIRLGPLSPEVVVELLAQGFGAEVERVRPLATRLHARTHGNPFFIEQLVKSLVERGRLQERNGAWSGWDVEELELPPSVREVVAARLAALPADARAVADAVAVVGTRAAHDALEALDVVPHDRLLVALDVLRRARVLVERADEGAIVYDFAHPLLRDTLYAELGLARVRALHERVAERLERFYARSAGEAAGPLAHADELAYHYVRADARRLTTKAVRYLQAAGVRALAQYADREAADYLGAALALAEREAESEAAAAADELVPELARARQRIGDYDGARTLWERARNAAEERGAWGAVAAIERRLGLAAFWSGRHADALAHYEAGIVEAERAGDRSLQARLHVAAGMCFQALGRRDEAGRQVDQALVIAEALGEPALLARVHRALLLLRVWTGPADAARRHGERAIALAEASGEPGVAWSAHWALATLAGLTGDAPAVARHLSEARRVADALRSPLLRVWTAEVEIEYAAGIGEWDDAVAVAERTIAMARALGQRALLPRLLVWAALVRFGRGEVAAGKAYVDEAWTLSGADAGPGARDVHAVVPAHTGRAAYHLTMRELDRAIAVGEAGLAIADRSGYVVWGVHRLLPVIGEAALWAADLERARHVGARLRRDSERLGHPLGLAWADSCDAVVELLEGDKRKAVTLLRGAAERLEAIPFVPDAARVRRQLARALAETGDTEGATRELRRAHDVFAHLGAEPELAATREQLRALGARPPVRAQVAGIAGLTGRELEIVRLVAQRRSNKEIGEALDISARTVSTHLSNIFAKMEVRSRGELTDVARRMGLATD